MEIDTHTHTRYKSALPHHASFLESQLLNMFYHITGYLFYTLKGKLVYVLPLAAILESEKEYF